MQSSKMPDQGTECLDGNLNEARSRIQVSPAEMDEARIRRADLADALTSEFQGSRTYLSGSLAHGDALTPLADFDLGIVLPDPHQLYGPGKVGPRALREAAAEAIRRGLKPKYGDLSVQVEGLKRSVLVRFRDPVAPDLPDFTADVIVAIDNPDSDGLYIPRWRSWDRSHPEEHTRLVVAANQATSNTFARTIRLVKHWNRRHGRPLCSWHIKALALDVVTEPMQPSTALLAWFESAAESLASGETADPAGVAPHTIKTRIPRMEAVGKLNVAANQLREALALANGGRAALAQEKLSKWINDEEVLPAPALTEILAEGSAGLSKRPTGTAPALITGVGAGTAAARPDVRSWRY